MNLRPYLRGRPRVSNPADVHVHAFQPVPLEAGLYQCACGVYGMRQAGGALQPVKAWRQQELAARLGKQSTMKVGGPMWRDLLERHQQRGHRDNPGHRIPAEGELAPLLPTDPGAPVDWDKGTGAERVFLQTLAQVARATREGTARAHLGEALEEALEAGATLSHSLGREAYGGALEDYAGVIAEGFPLTGAAAELRDATELLERHVSRGAYVGFRARAKFDDRLAFWVLVEGIAGLSNVVAAFGEEDLADALVGLAYLRDA